jgi:protein DPCD
VRKWKRYREFGEAKWEWEIGEPQQAFNPEADLLAPSGDNVSICTHYVSNDVITYVHL